MTTLIRLPLAIVFAALGAAPVLAQEPDTTQPADSAQPRIGPTVRQIATAAAVSTVPIGSILGVRELPDGRVLVNDGQSRRLLLLDTMMVLDRVVLDSLSERENTYGTEEGILIAHRGDSSLFVDQESIAMLVIDPLGEIVRVRAAPAVRGAFRSRNRQYGTPITDARGRYVYEISARPAPPTTPPPPGVPWIPEFPDSAFIVALDLDTRELDTLGVVRTPREEYSIRARPGGGFSISTLRNPLRAHDLWGVLSDGSVAFVRAIDYRVEYLNPDGSWTSSGKIPYDWRQISAEEKERIVDSVRAAETFRATTSFTTSVIRYVNTYNRDYPDDFRAPEGYVPPNGFVRGWRFPPGVTFPERYIYGCAAGEEPTILKEGEDDDSASAPPAAAGEERRVAEVLAATGVVMPGPPPQGTPSCIPQPVPNLARIPNAPQMRNVDIVSPSALPDFFPPFEEDALRADMDGNLWIQANQPGTSTPRREMLPAGERPGAMIAAGGGGRAGAGVGAGARIGAGDGARVGAGAAARRGRGDRGANRDEFGPLGGRGGPIYDIISREGKLVDRIQVPRGYTIVGFGRGRVVYVATRDRSGVHLARVRLK